MYNCDPTDCWDDDPRTGNCTQLVAAGQCTTNTAEMMVRCKKSCRFCDSDKLILDCTTLRDGNYVDPANPCSNDYYTCSNGDAYLFVIQLNNHLILN